MPDDKQKRKPQETSILDFTGEAILKAAKGDLAKALKSHVTPAYLLVEELRGCPPNFPPRLGFLNPEAIEVWRKLWFRLGMIFSAYEKKVEEAGSELKKLQKEYDADKKHYVAEHNKQFDLREEAEKKTKEAEQKSRFTEQKYKANLQTVQSLEKARSSLSSRLSEAVSEKSKLEQEYGKRLQTTENELTNTKGKLSDEIRLTRRLEDEKKTLAGERDAAAISKQQTEGTLATRIRELAGAITAKEQAEQSVAAKSKELIDTETAKKLVEGTLATRVRELTAAVAAKELAEKHFAELKPQFEKVSKEYGELQTKFSQTFATASAMIEENEELYTQIDDFVKKVAGFSAALEVELKRVEDLEKKLEMAEKKLGKSQLRVRAGWYAAAASLVIGIAGYIGWSQSERPNVIQIVQQTTQPPVQPIKPVEPAKVEQLETTRYVMGAYLIDLPDKSVAALSKNEELEKRAKSVRYIAGAYLVGFGDDQFVVSSEKREEIERQNLAPDKKKELYEKIAAKVVKN